MMTMLAPKVSWPVLIPGTVLLLGSLYFAVRFFSGKQQRDLTRKLQKYFNDEVCPSSEFASYLQKLPLNYGLPKEGRLPEIGPLCPKEWLEKEDEELNSDYYLRTGRQISLLSVMEPAGSWYGLEAWICDILASKGDPCHFAGIEQRDKAGNGEDVNRV